MPAFLGFSVNVVVKRFPLSEFLSSAHAPGLRNGETFSEAVSISRKVPIMQCVHARGWGGLLSISSEFSGAQRQKNRGGNHVYRVGFSRRSRLPRWPGACTFLGKARLIFVCCFRLGS